MRTRPLLLMLLCGLICACNFPAEALRLAAPTAQPTASTDENWRTVAEGLTWRTVIPDGDELAQLIVVRIDPALYRFRAHYSPGQPKRLSQWRDQLPEAAVIINANFFDETGHALGAVVSDGIASGRAYRERGGSFIVRGGEAAVLANWGASFEFDGGIEQMIQGFPLLVAEGLPSYASTGRGERTRRTVIAQDAAGQILIIVAPFLGQSLADLSAFLAEADLAIVTAVNLDGGGSTLIALPDADYLQPSFDAVPTVLALYPR